MPGGKPKLGLRVKHSDAVVKPRVGRGRMVRYTPMPDGWYIFVAICRRWRPLLDLRFLRQGDALRAAAALTAAGLDSAGAMKRAGLAAVKQVACECLQW
jgi:hypothetical protein